jgi:tetratricopeptide (TPR) repeat protein
MRKRLPGFRAPLRHRASALLVGTLALLGAGSTPAAQAAANQAADAAPLERGLPPDSLPGPTAPALPPADLATRCVDALMPHAPAEEGAWCDVQIDTLNRRFDRTARENTELVAAYHNRAVLRTRQGQFELAAADLAAALDLAPGRPELYLTRGNLRMAQSQFVQALEDYNLAIEQSGGREAAYFRNRALVLRALGEVEAAVSDALRAR